MAVLSSPFTVCKQMATHSFCTFNMCLFLNPLCLCSLFLYKLNLRDIWGLVREFHEIILFECYFIRICLIYVVGNGKKCVMLKFMTLNYHVKQPELNVTFILKESVGFSSGLHTNIVTFV